MRKKIVAANWKMNMTQGEAARFVEVALLELGETSDVEIVVVPPYTAIPKVTELLRESPNIKVGAQNMYWERSGAFTGEVSAPMLIDLGVEYVILGHSERRQYFGETNEDVRRKTAAALENGLTPIVAVGETLDIRRAGQAQSHVVAQTLAAFEGLEAPVLGNVVIAYEPVWAIGTGENCKASDANEIMHAIRECRDGLQHVPILYGGSVKPENIAQYAAQPDIDGGLVGGASLDPETFALLATGAA